jgi:hypothetical protein
MISGFGITGCIILLSVFFNFLRVRTRKGFFEEGKWYFASLLAIVEENIRTGVYIVDA